MTDWLRHLIDLPPLLSVLLKSTVVLALGWGLHFALYRSNPRWRVLVWRGVLAGVLVIPLLQPLAGLEISVAPPPPPMEIREPIAPIALTAVRPIPTQSELSPPHSVVVRQPPPSFSLRDWGREHAFPIGLACWILVTAVLAVRLMLGLQGTWQRVQSSTPASETLKRDFEGVAQDLKCSTSVSLWTSSEIASPFLTGVRKSVLLVPTKYEEEEHARDLPAIFAHECGHLLSHDLWWMLAARWVSVLLWFHPLVWLVQKAHASACEEVCDAIAADYSGDTEAYSGTLARVALNIVGRAPAVGGIPMARSSDLSERLRKLQIGLTSSSLARGRVLAALTLAVLALLLLASLKVVRAGETDTGADSVDGMTDRASFTVCAPSQSSDSVDELISILLGTESEISVEPVATLEEAVSSSGNTLVLWLPRGGPPTETDLLEKLKSRKILGIGTGAAVLFGELGLEISRGNCIHAPADRLMVENSSVLRAKREGSPITTCTKPIDLDDPDRDNIAVFLPQWSPLKGVVEVIARWKEIELYAPIVKQGNCVLTGLDVPATEWTEEYGRLVHQISSAMLQLETEPFKPVQWQVTLPGTLSFHLGEFLNADTPFARQFYFKFATPTRFQAGLRYRGSKALMMQFRGDSPSPPHSTRKDADDGGPLDISVEITQEDLRRIGDRYWLLHIGNFDREHIADCTLEIQYDEAAAERRSFGYGRADNSDPNEARAPGPEPARVAIAQATTGSVQGQVWIGDRVSESSSIIYSRYAPERGPTAQRPIPTDSEGRFQVDDLPSGKYRFQRYISYTLRAEDGYTRMGTGTHSATVEVKAGATSDVTIGGKGRLVEGHLVPQSNAEGETVSIHSLERRLLQSVDTRDYVVLDIAEDGTFNIPDVQPGKWRASFTAVESMKNPRDRDVHVIPNEFAIPAATPGHEDEPFDLGEVEVWFPDAPSRRLEKQQDHQLGHEGGPNEIRPELVALVQEATLASFYNLVGKSDLPRDRALDEVRGEGIPHLRVYLDTSYRVAVPKLEGRDYGIMEDGNPAFVWGTTEVNETGERWVGVAEEGAEDAVNRTRMEISKALISHGRGDAVCEILVYRDDRVHLKAAYDADRDGKMDAWCHLQAEPRSSQPDEAQEIADAIVPPSEDLEDTSVSPQERTAHFPENLSLGRLQLRDATLSPTIASYLEGEHFGKAQGEVVAPPGKHLALYLGRDGARDLSPFAKLKPDDLQLLAITNWENVKDEDLVYLKGLTGLTCLVLEWNGYTGSGLEHLKEMKNLVKLKVGGTSLTDEGIAHLSGLTSLQFFSAYGRGISDRSLEHIRAFSDLKSLWLTETSVTDEGTEVIGGMKTLEYLRLGNTRITDEGLAHLRDLVNLKSLAIGSNNITDAGMIHLAGLKNLETLDIAGNPIGDRGLAPLSDMRNLSFLSAGSTQITDAGLFHVRGLPSLDLLFLSGIGDEGITHLATLPMLRNLQIHQAKVTAKSIPHFRKMGSLQYLNLIGPEISDDLLEALRSALPNVSVRPKTAVEVQ